MATSKKTRPASKKATVKKTAIAKKKITALKTSTTKDSKSATKTKKQAVKKVVKPSAPAKKSIAAKSKVKKAVAPKPATKGVDRKKGSQTKTVSKAVKSAPSKKTTSKEISKEKSAKVIAKEQKVIPAKKVEVALKTKASANKEILKTIPGKPNQEKQEPLQIKADRAIKELEETMDLSKVRPRIQAGTTPMPKPVHRQSMQPLKLIEPTNTNKVKFQLEFEFRASPKILYNYLCDSSGLAGWFADEVKTKDNLYTFVWEGSELYAKLVASRDQHLVRFQWQ